MSNWIYIAGGAVMFLTLIIIMFAGNKKKAPFDARKQQRSLDALPDVNISAPMPPVKKPKTRKRTVRRDEMIEHMRKLQKQKTQHGPLTRPPPPPSPPQRNDLIPGARIMIDDIKDEIHNAMSEVKDELKTVKKDLNKMVKDFDRDFYFAGSPGVRIRDPEIAAQLKHQKLAREQEELKKQVDKEHLKKFLQDGMNKQTLEIYKHGRRGTSSRGPG